VLFEAKARALPIIATEAGAIPEHLRAHAGAILVPPNDGAALSQAIRQLRAQRAAGQTLRA
jgi:glycosyltransferase involved in cell wall biosynthesis